MPTQTEAGKAFEYAILQESFQLLSTSRKVTIQRDNSFGIAESCFKLFNKKEQTDYEIAAKTAIIHILELEPHLSNPASESDSLTLQIVPDSEGIKGDVRDVLFIRSSENWEIGISAKNNHKAVKHSRLSDKINFGKEWLDLNCSEKYYKEITPIFFELRRLKTWRIVEKFERETVSVLFSNS